MEKKQYEICHEVLRRFHKHGLLNEIILIGSWCLPFYEEYFRPSKVMDEASLKTRDIDFLIPRPSRITKKVDIPELVKDLGFVPTFGGGKGYMKLDHPNLIMEFLVPERGRGTDKPIPLPYLGMNASSIRYLTFISDNTILAKLDDFFIKLPHPANFALHKLIVSGKRKNKEKAEKDFRMAIDLLEALIAKGDQAIVKKVFESVPSKWRNKIMAGLDKDVHRRILEVLHPMNNPFFSFSTPMDMLNKAKQEFETMRGNPNTRSIMNFFVTTYHIKDYVKNADKILGPKLIALYKDQDFQICRFICNKGKHFGDKPESFEIDLAVVQPVNMQAEPIGEKENCVFINGKKIEIIELGRRLLKKWEKFLFPHKPFST